MRTRRARLDRMGRDRSVGRDGVVAVGKNICFNNDRLVYDSLDREFTVIAGILKDNALLLLNLAVYAHWNAQLLIVIKHRPFMKKFSS